MENISIRKVSANELEALREISISTFIESFGADNTEDNLNAYLQQSRSIEKLASEYNTAGSAFYFAILEQKPIGYLKINTGEAQIENRDKNSLEVERIYVLKEFQNFKVGQLLLDAAIRIARDIHCEFIWLGVWEHNLRAIKFYERNGFSFFGKHEFMLGLDPQTDLLMKKEV